MNNQEMIAILREDVVTVDVIFLDGNNKHPYTFFCIKDIADHLEIDDLVMVDTTNGIKLGQVRDMEDKIGTGSLGNYEYRYIFQKVDTRRLYEIKEQNKRFNAYLREHRRSKARNELLELLGVDDKQRQQMLNITKTPTEED